MSRKCKTISFDVTDEVELKLLDYVELKPNFSRYMKRLIEKDMSGLYDCSIDVRRTMMQMEYEVDGTVAHEEMSDCSIEIDENDMSSYI